MWLGLGFVEEGFDISKIVRLAVPREAFQKDPAIALFHHAIVKERKDTAVLYRADQPAKSLLEGDHGRRNLVIEECIPARRIDGTNARGHHRVVWNRKRKPVNDDAAQLLAL